MRAPPTGRPAPRKCSAVSGRRQPFPPKYHPLSKVGRRVARREFFFDHAPHVGASAVLATPPHGGASPWPRPLSRKTARDHAPHAHVGAPLIATPLRAVARSWPRPSRSRRRTARGHTPRGAAPFVATPPHGTPPKTTPPSWSLCRDAQSQAPPGGAPFLVTPFHVGVSPKATPLRTDTRSWPRP